MDTYKVEKVWESSGFKCVVLMTKMGHRCGYVGLPKEHPLYGVAYNSHSDWLKDAWKRVLEGPIGKRGVISLLIATKELATPELIFDVHGSITYSKDGNSYPIEAKDIWWFGFDCAHDGDAPDISSLSPERKNFELRFPSHGQVRSLDYCIKECESLARQIKEIEK